MKVAVFAVNAVCYIPNLILGLVDLGKVGLEIVSDARYMKGYNAGYDEGLKHDV